MVNVASFGPVQGKDIKLVISGFRGQEIQRALEKRTKILGRVRGYEFKGAGDLRQSRSRFVPPIYDLAEIARAADAEAYINQSIRKHREQILKEGYQISGSDEEMVSYIKKRLFEIMAVTGITTEQWLRETVTNLITYHNAFLVFRRDPKRSSGKGITMFGKELDPIAGIFVGDPTTMQVAVDKWGTPKRWRQYVEGFDETDITVDKSYPPEDVVHISMDRRTGFTFGTPYLLPVLDDIRALRKLEEVAIIVASKEAFPLYHYKVGTEKKPAIQYDGGGDEVAAVHAEIQALPVQGYIVTSERHEVNLVSKQGAALDLAPFLEYFEARVIAGLRLSPLDLGRGGGFSRGTATNLNKGLQDSAKDYQMVISDHLTNFVVFQLLLEGGFDVTEENMVKITFPTIDREEERAQQNHGMQLYMGDTITEDEFRKSYLNKQPLQEGERVNSSLRKQTEAQKEIVRTQGAARAAAGGGSDLGITSVKNTITNKGQPTNQSGTKPAKSRFKANDYYEKVKEKYSVTKSLILTSLDSDISEGILEDGVEDYLREFVKASVDLSRPYIEEKITDGLQKAKKEYSLLYPDEDVDFDEVGNRAIDRFFTNFVTKSFWKVITPFRDQIFDLLVKDEDGNINAAQIMLALNALGDSINLLITDQLITAHRFGFIKLAKKVGSKSVDLVNPDTQERFPLDVGELVYKNFIPTLEDANFFLSFPK